MKILDKYLIGSLIKYTLLALAVLVGLFVFFALIDELEDSGTGRYGIVQVLEYLVLTIPNLMSELFPIAAVIGGMITLGNLSSSNELAVIRTSGVSQPALMQSLAKGAVVICVLAVIIGELVAPYSEQAAQHRKSIALTEQITLKTNYGFWSRNENNFINIRKILPGNEVEEIYIYEFDNDNNLRNSIYAKRAKYIDENWQLEDVKQSQIFDDRVVSKPIEKANWASVLNPEVINLVIIKPQFLTLWGLHEYIEYLDDNEQNSQIYKQAFWYKIGRPFAIILMVLIAVPMVKVYARQNNVGQRVFLGCLLGIIFHMVNQIFGHLGVVYNINPFISMLCPLLLLAGFMVLLFYREHIGRLITAH